MGASPLHGALDDYGLLIDPENWSPALGQQLAARNGIVELTEHHWAFIYALRAYYAKFNAPPPPHKVCHDLNLEHNCAHELFDTCLNAWRIAGLPDPGEEAKAYLSAD